MRVLRTEWPHMENSSDVKQLFLIIIKIIIIIIIIFYFIYYGLCNRRLNLAFTRALQ